MTDDNCETSGEDKNLLTSTNSEKISSKLETEAVWCSYCECYVDTDNADFHTMNADGEVVCDIDERTWEERGREDPLVRLSDLIDLLNERIEELGLKGASPTNKVAIASRRGEMKRLRDQLEECSQKRRTEND